ncbi:MAG: glycoside hydrolase family 2, partial [Clostridia bacterium]|nr:glycoside hydrolase family 2 [Clostridia bacterium]
PEGEKLSGGDIPLSVYPRPRMVRSSYLCLNGEWDFGWGKSPKYGEKILVPFPPQSLLSRIEKKISQSDTLFYKRSFTLPESFSRGERIIIHIGAADQYASVYLNGKRLGEHEGGYESFSFDITEHLEPINELKITVRDELDSFVLPYGKQCEKRGGMWYTPFSGIWQTVWLESVPENHITGVSADCDTECAIIKVTASGKNDGVLIFEGEEIPLADGMARIKPADPILWSPENPHLYYFKVRLGKDEISSYFALRKIESRVIAGIPRLCLNGKPYFFHGVLDQGYFSDGICTPADSVSFERDIKLMKEMGFNTLRKHIKTEPEQFYYDCDRLGMIVFQDMINNGPYSFIRDTALPTVGLKCLPDKFMHRNKKTRAAFERSAVQTVMRLKNHPSVCYFTIFNEGWGQFDSEKMYHKIKAIAPNHIIDTASGWFKGAESDVVSPHVYFKPVKIKKADKPIVLSEFGGYSHSPEGHVFNPYKTYGYKLFESTKDLENAIVGLYEKEIIPAVKNGLCGAILTQFSDVEDETNGLVTYDRKLVKVSKGRMQRIAEKLYKEIEK